MLKAGAEKDVGSTGEFSKLRTDGSVPATYELPLEVLQRYSKRPEEFQISLTYQGAKRGLDICSALVGLAILGLLLPIIALSIWLEDRGPIFYQQVRVGQYGWPFTTYKFRSMTIDADDYLTNHPELWKEWQKIGKLVDDPRVTRVGRILRRTSIDELPQLLNVLRGEVSLVGPRAIQFSEVDRFGEFIVLRQRVKPGLTGLWQVSGRSITDYEQRVALDYRYVMEYSFRNDVYILLKTIPAVISGIGAY